jgi:hypothetical protein
MGCDTGRMTAATPAPRCGTGTRRMPVEPWPRRARHAASHPRRNAGNALAELSLPVIGNLRRGRLLADALYAIRMP